jgi:hypothetical protein
VPPKFNVPAPVKINLDDVPEVVTFPRVTVPEVILIVVNLEFVVALIVNEPAVSVPAFTLMVLVRLLLGLGIIIAPDTYKVVLPEIVKLEVEVFVKFKVVHSAGELIVTASVPPI